MLSLPHSANDDDFAQLANCGAITRQLFVTCCIQCSCQSHPCPLKCALWGTRTASVLSKVLPHTMYAGLTEREQDNTNSMAHLIDTASSSNSESSKRGFLGKLKEKQVVSKANLEANRQQKETERQKFLVRRDKQRAEVNAEPKGEPNLYGGFFTDGPTHGQ
ncbi:hypothetical protein DFH08DRAFT_832848 [Mycena albidolilacea]|uniref:Uncharacterized protein n=1 Tax=Mycena albidolilacea TaxID=1033008 RepID=A0AAD7AVY0_9AGAR|nr:hypothetical protein DFH08DRAFT_832848 [Mycena albidolilacea]